MGGVGGAFSPCFTAESTASLCSNSHEWSAFYLGAALGTE